MSSTHAKGLRKFQRGVQHTIWYVSFVISSITGLAAVHIANMGCTQDWNHNGEEKQLLTVVLWILPFKKKDSPTLNKYCDLCQKEGHLKSKCYRTKTQGIQHQVKQLDISIETTFQQSNNNVEKENRYFDRRHTNEWYLPSRCRAKVRS